MKRLAAVVLVLGMVCAVVSFAVAGDVRELNVSGQAVNSSPLLGPEGIVLGPDGNFYIGEHDGRIRRVTPDGEVQEFADLNDLPGERQERISVIGLAMDKAGDIYAATLTFDTGCVMKVIGPGKPDAGAVSLFRRGIGSANFVLIDDDTGTMYVSDSSMLSGRVFGFDMTDETRIGGAVDPATEVLGKFRYANGLALSPDKQWLYVAETTKGRISRINLATRESEVFAKVGGWADGLALNPEKTLLYACDNKGGRIVAVNLSGEMVGAVHLTGREGQCAPACLLFPDPETIVFTDLWKASTLDALLGRPTHHSYIYRLSVSDVVQ